MQVVKTKPSRYMKTNMSVWQNLKEASQELIEATNSRHLPSITEKLEAFTEAASRLPNGNSSTIYKHNVAKTSSDLDTRIKGIVAAAKARPKKLNPLLDRYGDSITEALGRIANSLELRIAAVNETNPYVAKLNVGVESAQPQPILTKYSSFADLAAAFRYEEARLMAQESPDSEKIKQYEADAGEQDVVALKEQQYMKYHEACVELSTKALAHIFPYRARDEYATEQYNNHPDYIFVKDIPIVALSDTSIANMFFPYEHLEIKRGTCFVGGQLILLVKTNVELVTESILPKGTVMLNNKPISTLRLLGWRVYWLYDAALKSSKNISIKNCGLFV